MATATQVYDSYQILRFSNFFHTYCSIQMIPIRLHYFLLSLSLLSHPALVLSAELPEVTVSDVRCIVETTGHNAFTDMHWFKGHIYLAYRHCPDGHNVHPTSSIVILRSSDGINWQRIHVFSVPNRDTRDPHFAYLNGKLFLYTGTWYCGPERPAVRNMNQMVGYGTSTDDGDQWEVAFLMEGTYGSYVWRTAEHKGKIYICARRRSNYQELATLEHHAKIVESRLMVSEDGKRFTDAGLFQRTYGDETAFTIDSNGRITAIARRGANRTAELIRLDPPYQNPIAKDLGRYIGGPFTFLYDQWRIVAGRNIVDGRPVTQVCLLDGDNLVDLVRLPSGGDCSYPSMVSLCPGCILVAWYSSHEDAHAKIYTAKLNFN